MARIAFLFAATIFGSGLQSAEAAKPRKDTDRLATINTNATAPARAAMLQEMRGAHDLPKGFFGDLTCMRWTGGSCSVTRCSSKRGAKCEEAYCVCPPGSCANSEGVCDEYPGEWLGDHALAFTNAYQNDKPYVQAQDLVEAGWFDPEAVEAQRKGVSHMLHATADSSKYWKLALTGHGHVRFESNAAPGHIMTIYHVRRRRSDSSSRRRQTNFLQERRADAHPWKRHRADAHEEDPQESEKARLRLANFPREGSQKAPESLGQFLAGNSTADRVQISDNDDMWPVLMRFEEAHPIDASFRVRHTMKDGGGTEIWDPQHQVALSSANPEWMMRDRVAGDGIAECEAPGLLFGGNCEGRQLVDFVPPLPLKAVVVGPRDEIFEVGSLSFFETAIMVVCIIACMAGAGIAGGKMSNAH